MATNHSSEHITQLLNSIDGTNAESINQLLPLVYGELRKLASRELRKERVGHTLNTTALVHEAYLKLVNNPPSDTWNGRRHFFAIAARAMRQILVNYARNRSREKRGGKENPVTLNEAVYLSEQKADEIMALDEALSRLEQLSKRQSQVVEYRYFGGYNMEEIAEILEVSIATVNRDWLTAKTWLFGQLNPNQ
jgi:RNA polymerase sigma factor (TIGR02999 family)